MKIWVLMENAACHQDIIAEHGLSFYIETDSHKLLFDTGKSDAFARNAQKMGVDLSAVDVAILSHGHYDHSGGMEHFFQINHHAPLYINRRALGDVYNSETHYIGLSDGAKHSDRLVFVDEDLAIDETLLLSSCNQKPRPFPTNSNGLQVKTPDGIVPDDFLHEQYLTIIDKGRRIVISGCSHKGILNIMDWFAPDVLIGGFHFMKEDVSTNTNPALDQAAQTLMTYNTQYYTCHCTGQAQYQYLKAQMGDQLQYLSAGDVLEL